MIWTVLIRFSNDNHLMHHLIMTYFLCSTNRHKFPLTDYVCYIRHVNRLQLMYQV